MTTPYRGEFWTLRTTSGDMSAAINEQVLSKGPTVTIADGDTITLNEGASWTILPLPPLLKPTKNMYIDRGDSYIPTASQVVDEEATYTWSFTREAARRSTTVSSVEWSNQYGNNMSIQGEILADGVATAILSASHTGNCIVRTTAHFADGTSRVKCLKIAVLDPQTDAVGGYC